MPINKKSLIYLCLFTAFGFILLQIPFTNIVGSGQKFSLFDFFAPASGAFLTSIWGALSVVVVKLVNVIVSGQSFDTATIIRLFPLALGAIYFGTRKYKTAVAAIPLICMILFIIHPQGRAAWYYSLYWLIPLATAFTKKSLIFNSLGATFTAHAVGSVAFLYAFNLPAEVWITLIPVVFLERMLFTAGTAVSYVAVNSLTYWISHRFALPTLQQISRSDYTFSRKLLINL